MIKYYLNDQTLKIQKVKIVFMYTKINGFTFVKFRSERCEYIPDGSLYDSEQEAKIDAKGGL